MSSPLGLQRFGNPLSIYYVVVHTHEDAGTFTPFQGFGAGLLLSPSLFSHAAVLPVDIRELYMSREDIVVSRMLGARMKVFPLQLDSLATFASMASPLTCVLADEKTRGHVGRICELSGDRLLLLPSFVDTARAPVRRGERSVDRWDALHAWRKGCVDLIFALAERRASALQETAPIFADELRRAGTASRAELVSLPLTGINHFVTQPNEHALLSLGFQPSHTEGIADVDDSHYAAAQMASAMALHTLRGDALRQFSLLKHSRTPDLILSAPALLAHLYARRHRRSGKHADAALGRALALDLMAQQEGYTLSGKVKQPLNEQDKFMLAAALGIRRNELALLTGAVSVRSASDVAPALRLPAAINKVRPVAHRLATHARSHSRDAGRTLNRLARKLSESLDKCVPQDFVPLLENSEIEQVLLLADAPLEWLTVRGIPLMLQKTCSRIPVTPGNMFLANALSVGSDLRLGLSDFEEVLILRSLTARDPLRNVLVDACTRMVALADMEAIKLRIVDVASADGFVAALNEYGGAIMIYDGHGIPGTSTTPSKLAIGDSPFDPWELRFKARIPSDRHVERL